MRRPLLVIIVLLVLLPLTRPAVSAQGWPPRNGATLPATCTVGEIFYVTTATTTTPYRCTDDNPDTWIPFEATTSTEINVKDYGAVCNGVTDDSAALQAAFDAADSAPARIVKLPPSTCLFITPLVVGNDYPSYSHVTIEGVNRDLSILAYAGATDQVAVQIRHNGFFEMRHFSVTFTGTKGTTVGIGLDASTEGGTGTQVVTGTFWHMLVSGFAIGMRYGGGVDQAASEMACWHCQLSNNTTGFSSLSQNSLNFWFYNLGIAGNGCGMYLTGDGPMVLGGHSASNTTADFCVAGGFGVISITQFRSEAANRFVDTTCAGCGPADRILLRDNVISDVGVADDILIEAHGSQIILEGNIIIGKVAVTAQGYVRMMNNTTIPAADGRPANMINTPWTSAEIDFSQNTNYTTGLRYPDIKGLVIEGKYVVWETRLNDEADPPGGGLALNSTRSIGYGSATVGRNIRDRVTFATSATANFTFKRTVSVSTTAASNDITFTSGVITAIDVGKKILIPNAISAGDCFGGQTDDDYVGRISELLSATSARMIPIQFNSWTTTRCGQGSPGVTGAQASTVIGEDEPDANYFVLGCQSSVSGETYGISSIATTGFTATSSNASSTATLTCPFMR